MKSKNNPLFHKLKDILDKATTSDDAINIIKQYGKNNNFDPTQLEEFFNENKNLFHWIDKQEPSIKKSKKPYESKKTGGRKQQKQDKINKQKQQELDNEYGDIFDEAIEKDDIRNIEKQQKLDNEYGDVFDEAINQEKEKQKKRQQEIEQNQKNFENNQKKYTNDPEYKYRQQRAKYNVDNISEQFENPEDLLNHLKKQRRDNKTNFSEKDYYDIRDYIDLHKDEIKWKNTNTKNVVKETVKEAAEENLEKSSMKRIFNKRTFGIVANSYFAISDYKEAREEGKGVIGAGLKSAGLLVAGETLGGAMLPIMLAKSAPSMAVSAIEGMQRMTRQMNSISRLQTFGDTQFQDTKQLATMRQAGMELAKMSQYNLQQSIMGNEAQSMHRL